MGMSNHSFRQGLSLDADWHILTDARYNLIRARLGGFFSIDDVRRFALDYRAALAKLPSHGHLTLVDIKSMKIQSQEVVEAFTRFMASADIQSRKLAFISGSTLARLQAQRLTSRDTVGYFDTSAEAETWLLS